MTRRGGKRHDSARRTVDVMAGQKVYIVSGSSEADWDMYLDVPRELYQDWEHFSCPQAIGIASLPGLALEMGIHAITKQMDEDYENEKDEDPRLEARWVDVRGKPYNETCPMHQPKNKHGRPCYVVWLKGVDRPGGAFACVVVQEFELDKQEVD